MKLRLSHPQKRIWYVEKSHPQSYAHNLAGVMRLTVPLDLESVQEALNIVIKQNVALQLRFDEEEGIPFQYVDESMAYLMEYIDFSLIKEKERKAKFEEWVNEKSKKIFDLKRGPLFSLDIYKYSEKEYGFLAVMHHIISDGWTMHLFMKKLFEILDGEIQNRTHSYLDFLKLEDEYFESKLFEKNKAFWKSQFENLPENNYRESSELSSRRIVKKMDSTLSEMILKEIEESRLSLNTFMIVSKAIYDYKLEGKKDVIYGIPVLNRSGRSLKNTIGMFTSTVPIRFNISGEMSIDEIYENALRAFKQCLKNQKYPFDLVFEDLQLRRKGYQVLFDTYINYYVAQSPGTYHDAVVTTEEVYNGEQYYSLQIVIEQKNDELEIFYDFKTALYSSEEIETLHKYMILIIKQMLNSKFEQIKNIDVLTPTEKQYKYDNYNLINKASIYKTVIDFFAENVEEQPSKIAVYEKDKQYTYLEFDHLVNQYANYFAEIGIKVKDRIGIMLPHSAQLLMIVYALHKCGACYIPLAPDYPLNRMKYILKDSEASLLITNKIMDISINTINIHNINLDGYSKIFLSKAQIDELAYIIYTSGSTGNPKGVMVTHKNLSNYIAFSGKRYLPDEEDIMAFYSSISFDLTVTSMFAPLVAGRSIDVYNSDQEEFVLFDVFENNRANVIKLTPSHLRLLTECFTDQTKVNRLILGGENLTRELSISVCQKKPEIEILNEYGPTETTVGCMLYKFDEQTSKGINVSIGRGAANARILIMDEDLNIVPDGRIGEIFVGGVGVTAGYLNNTVLTNQVFINYKGERVYKTGDLGCYTLEGIEYHGRKDHQVKIRGHRIEIEEIQNIMRSYKMIQNAAVKVVQDRIQAYVVTTLNEIEIRNMLKDDLPNYMIPNDLMIVEEIFLTTNGKINFDALPEFQDKQGQLIRPSSELEYLFISICEDILNKASISMSDNFYEIGGDSIKAIQIVSKLKNAGYDLKVKQIMQSESIQAAARNIVIQSQRIIANQNKVIGVNGHAPMFKWFERQNFINPNYYTQSILLDFDSKFGFNRVQDAVRALLTRHDVLNLNFVNNSWTYNEYPIEEIIFYKNCIGFEKTKLEEIILETSTKVKASFDIVQKPIIQVVYFDTGTPIQHLLFSVHHIGIDGVSWRILLDELNQLLKGLSEYQNISKTTSFQEWTLALNHFKTEDILDETLWRFLRRDQTEYRVMNFRKSHAEMQGKNETRVLKISLDRFNQLVLGASQKYNLRTHELLVFIVTKAIAKVFDQNTFILELEHHGRFEFNKTIDVSKTIGWFTMMYPVPIMFNKDVIDHQISAIKDTLREYEGKGYQYLLHDLQETHNHKMIRFNYLGDFSKLNEYDSFKLSELLTGPDNDLNNRSSALFEINSMISNEGLNLNLDYHTSDFDEKIIMELLDEFILQMEVVEKQCSRDTEVELSRSDFEDLDISLDDFEMIFS